MGARAAAPPLPGLDGVPWLDNGRILQLRELPSHLVVLGGGFIGCEFAQMFRRFGSDVTVIDAAEHLLAREDPEVSTALADVFRGEGIALELGARPQAVRRSDAGVSIRLGDGREISGSHLLVAAGRRPNTDDLGFDADPGFDIDQTPAYDLTEPEPLPDFNFDQSHGA